MLKIVRKGEPAFDQTLRALETRGDEDLTSVEPAVRAILDDVRARGDEAVLDACERFEKRRPDPLFKLIDGEPALRRLPSAARSALELAAVRIREFHEHQRDLGFKYKDGGAV